MDATTTVRRTQLCADALLSCARAFFERVADARRRPTYTLTDCLMAGLAMFHLKEPSLLAFQGKRFDENLCRVYGLGGVPCDSQLRDTLDAVDPAALRPAFRGLFRALQRGKGLEGLVFFQDCYLISLDGVEYFSSEAVHCPRCLERTSRGGTTTYYHQLLGAALVHPDHGQVIPLAPEPIQRQDGQTKNDCERNAARRWLAAFRQEHPRLPVIITEDGLASNGPHIRDLIAQRMHFILGAKEGDHAALHQRALQAVEQGAAGLSTIVNDGINHRFLYLNNVPLNDSHPDLLVNFLEYWEEGPSGVQHFSWVTDLWLRRGTLLTIMRGGRARWRIENETFNTLKNQGYAFEHNFGHGAKQLCVVFAFLMLLAFLIDQIQQRFNRTFQAARAQAGSQRALWERIRGLFHDYVLTSLSEVYAALAYGIERPRLVLRPRPDTS